MSLPRVGGRSRLDGSGGWDHGVVERIGRLMGLKQTFVQERVAAVPLFEQLDSRLVIVELVMAQTA